MVPWFQAAWPREGVALPISPEMVFHVASFLTRQKFANAEIARIRGIAVAPIVPPVRKSRELARIAEERIRKGLIWGYFKYCG